MNDDLQRRNTDKPLGMVKVPFTLFWDWIDNRNIELHIGFYAMFYLTIDMLKWVINFSDTHANLGGGGIAAVIAAVWGPWLTALAAFWGFYANARK